MILYMVTIGEGAIGMYETIIEAEEAIEIALEDYHTIKTNPYIQEVEVPGLW